MAVTTFAFDVAGVVYAGNCVDADLNYTYLGLDWRQNANCVLEFTGTDLEVLVFGNSDNCQVSIDGGAYSNVATGSADSHYITLATGLSEGAHTVKLRQLTYMLRADPSGGASATWRVTGASPAIGAADGFDSSFVLRDTTTYITTDGGADYSTNLGGQRGFSGTTGASIRFRASCDTVTLFAYNGLNGGGPWALYRDGVYVAEAGSASTPSSPVYDFITLATGLDTSEAEYAIYAGNQGFYSTVLLGGGTGVVTDALTSRKAILYYGDSITQGVGATNGLTGFPVLTSAARGKGVRNLGVSGSVVVDGYGGTQPGNSTTRKNAVIALKDVVDTVVILYGTNDLGIIPGTYDLNEFESQYDAMLGDLLAGMNSGTKFYCLGILDRTGVTTTRDDLNARISAAEVSAGDANTFYVDTDGWITPASDTGDGLHPNDTGNGKVATNLLGEIPAAVVVSIAESSIERGQSGQTLTVTITGGTSSGTGDWSLAVGGSSGSITAQSGSNPYTLTVTAPQTAGEATLTFTPGGPGSSDTVTVSDTVAPDSPSGVSAGSPTVFSVPVSFTLPAASPAGETITGRAYKNDVQVATGVTSPYTFTGVVGGDTLGITSYDGVNESAATEVTFTAPSGSGGVSGARIFGGF